MDFVCYGSARELIIYILTITTAASIALLLSKKLNPKRKRHDITLAIHPMISGRDLLVSLVFVISLVTGVAVYNKGFDMACGFSPDHEGMKRDSQLLEQQYRYNRAQESIQYLQR